ncbi:MAG: TonB-dependent receptor [Saprospiraceae bacterium]|nr:TonB-dependent receptor [Saprospiraceae bacterium]
MKRFLLIGLLNVLALGLYAQIEDQKIEPVAIVLDKYPVSFSVLDSTSIKNSNLGQDIPILLDNLTSVVSTSDAGAGVGYTGLRVRGSDASRVNVTINGVPLNDSESQGVFWVNMPDFASSVDNMVLVRGAGTSTNGAGAFGASLHLQTQASSAEAYGEYSGSAGTFNTLRNSVKFGSGLLNDRWTVEGRLSKITSDGFIDRATSDLQSYYFDTSYKLGDSPTDGQLKFITFAGHEVTYQAWFGIEESILANNRTFNPYTYENQVDDYQQDHYQLFLDQPLSDDVSLDIGLHYTKGQGFFEEFREQDGLGNYGIADQVIGGQTITESDLVRRRWLDNDFFGAIFSTNIYQDAHNIKVGGGWNKYLGDHFGEVISGQFIPQERIGQNYYFNDADKTDFNIYSKYTYDFESGFTPYVDLQFRRVNYDFEGLALDGSGTVTPLPQTVDHNFFNPKAGLTWRGGDNSAYASVSVAQKEPNRSDYTDSPADQLPVAEKLTDFELGYRYNGVVNAGVNFYFMDYKDQLAVTGGVNDVGAYTRVNVDDSYRAGVELEANWQPNEKFEIAANATFSQNRIESFVENIDDFDNGGAQQVFHEDTDLALSPNVIAGGNIAYAPIPGRLKVSLISKYVGDQFLDNTSTESRKIDAYLVNNLALNATLAENAGFIKAIDINARVNNLFDTDYEANGYTFGYIFGGETIYEEYYYPQAGTYFLGGLNVKF